jgi:hypothetical protein
MARLLASERWSPGEAEQTCTNFRPPIAKYIFVCLLRTMRSTTPPSLAISSQINRSNFIGIALSYLP